MFYVSRRLFCSISKSKLKVELYTKINCPLCDEVKGHLDESRFKEIINLTLVDILADKNLFEKYKYEIPVLVVNGQFVARGKISPEVIDLKLEEAILKNERS